MILVLNHTISKNMHFLTFPIHKMIMRNILTFIKNSNLLTNMVTWWPYLKTWPIFGYVFLHFLKCHEKMDQIPPSANADIIF